MMIDKLEQTSALLDDAVRTIGKTSTKAELLELKQAQRVLLLIARDAADAAVNLYASIRAKGG